MTAPVVEIRALTKRYEMRTVLDAITVSFARGVTALVGPSGGGKSTLLRCMNGLEPFDAGEIHAFGEVLRAGRADRAAVLRVRRRVGFVFQSFNLFAHRTALGNVIEAPIHVRKTPRAEAVDRGRALLAKVGLSHRQDAYPHEMSGGEQQRVAIARALAMDPEVLLLDEPTSALDPERKREVEVVMRKLADEGTTMVLVTHELRLARELAERVIELAGGRIGETH